MNTPTNTPHCRCGATWTGLTAAHCATCHTTFTSTTGFDRHRRAGQCLTPEAAGLVPIHRKTWTGYGLPGSYTHADD